MTPTASKASRSCAHCGKPLHPRNGFDRCGTCSRRFYCRDCGKPKEHASRSRCDSCRERWRSVYSKVYVKVHRQGRVADAPAWVEKRIRYYRRRAKKQLPLFAPTPAFLKLLEEAADDGR